MITTLLIIHGLCAVFLLGALTHQTLSAALPTRGTKSSFFSRFRGVNAATYTRFVVIAFALTMILGMVIYPDYRLSVRIMLEDLNLRVENGLFEVKEHFIAIGVGILPAYWYYWRQPLDPRFNNVRLGLTAILAFIVWWGFLVGHILSNVRGLA